MKSTNQITFKHSYKSLFIWFFCTFLIFGPLLTILRDFSFSSLFFTNVDDFAPIDNAIRFNMFLCYLLFLYFSYLSFFNFFPTHRILLFFGLLLALLIPVLIRFAIDQKLILWIFGETNYLPETTFSFYFRYNTYYAVYYIPSGILYYFHKRTQALQEARLEAERQRALAELTHLRTQINPHFLFNSLNNIYSLAYDKSDKFLGAIEGLSKLLRYALYEKSEYVRFDQEWTMALQMIKVEQMRLVDPVDFNIEIAEDVNEIMIPPLIILPLIENIFKHGDVQNFEAPPKIVVYRKNDYLKIIISNKISTKPQKDNQSGIGLENIKKRLIHLYGDQHTFDVLEKDDTFKAEISIPIK